MTPVKRTLTRLAGALAAGAVWPLAFAPFGWWPVAPLSLATLFLLVDSRTTRAAVGVGLAFGLGQFGAGVWWVYMSVHGFGGLHWSLAGMLTLALIVALAVFVAGFGWVCARFVSRQGVVGMIVGMPAAWVAIEWLRGWVLTGFPWLNAGYAFTDAPLGAWAPVGGVHAVSLAAAVTAGVIAWFVRGLTPEASAKGVSHGAKVGALAVVATIWIGGWALDGVRWTRPAGDPVSVALVQGNIGQDIKWSADQLEPTVVRYIELTDANLDADIVVWPEAALPALRFQLEGLLGDLDTLADDEATALVMGILDRDVSSGDFYNTVIALGDGHGRYAKRHLVPFGEFFPVPSFVREWLRLHNLPYSDFSPGADDQVLLQARGIPLAASVCYEAAYGATLIRAVPEAQLLVNVSNDAWFGDTIAPHQHLQINRVRAREAGRWMLRATNTGVTATIAPDGSIDRQLPQFEVGVLRAVVEPHSGATPYARSGNWPVLVVIALMLGGAGRFRYSTDPS